MSEQNKPNEAEIKAAKEKAKLALTEKVIGDFTQAEVNTLKNTIAAGTTPEQFNLFLQTCVNSGLNPFLNHIYAVVYGGKLSIQISVEGISHLARKQDNFKGYDVQTVHEKDEFKVSKVDGHLKVIQHDIGFPRGRIIGAYAEVYKEGAPDFVSLMESSEWEVHKTDGNNKHNWKKYEADFAKKTVLKRALKGQFGIEITEDAQIGGEDEKPQERREVSQEPQERTVYTGEEEAKSESELMQEQWDKVFVELKRLEWGQAELERYILQKFNKKPQDLNLQNLAALNKFMSFEKPMESKKPEPQPEPEKEEPQEEPKDDMDEYGDLFAGFEEAEGRE